MTTEQVALVQTTFAQVRPMADAAAALFYQRLFELDPSLRALFRTDLATQGRKLMTMLAVVVQGLSRPEQLLPAVRELGRRHAAYGVQASHYDTVGTALCETLAKALGTAFADDVASAWRAAYGLLSSVMQDAARQIPAAA